MGPDGRQHAWSPGAPVSALEEWNRGALDALIPSKGL